MFQSIASYRKGNKSQILRELRGLRKDLLRWDAFGPRRSLTFLVIRTGWRLRLWVGDLTGGAPVVRGFVGGWLGIGLMCVMGRWRGNDVRGAVLGGMGTCGAPATRGGWGLELVLDGAGWEEPLARRITGGTPVPPEAPDSKMPP
jgi:hypothetical protein